MTLSDGSQVRVVFDQRGFPIFDDIASFDTKLPSDVAGRQSRSAHMRAATRQLREAIANGQISASQFTQDQLRAIKGGRPNIPNLTWHHHQDIGRIQLISREVHDLTGHVGGFDMWFKKR